MAAIKGIVRKVKNPVEEQPSFLIGKGGRFANGRGDRVRKSST